MINSKYPDSEINTTLTSSGKSLHEREFKAAGGPTFEISMQATLADGAEQIDTLESEKRASFAQNLRYWNDATQFMAANDFKNSYFRRIVNMGYAAVPMILEEISKRPSFLFHALDEILPGIVEYKEGYIPVEKACATWISILSPIVRN